MQFYKKMGIEIEGAFDDLEKVCPTFKGDCSVKFDDYEQGERFYDYEDDRGYYLTWDELSDDQKSQAKEDARNSDPVSGEIASNPFGSLIVAENWVNRCYPIEVNKTCGLHIHLSFSHIKDYARLMTQDFYEFWRAELKKFGDKLDTDDSISEIFWDRYNGRNEFTRTDFRPAVFDPIRRSLTAYGQKYNHINYEHFTRAGGRTFECRSFPAFQTAKMTNKAIKFFVNSVEHYLANGDHKEEIINTNIETLKVMMAHHKCHRTQQENPDGIII